MLPCSRCRLGRTAGADRRLYRADDPDSGWLVEDRLTLADIAVAAPLADMTHARVAMGEFPKLTRWRQTMHARPSFVAALALNAQMMAPRG